MSMQPGANVCALTGANGYVGSAIRRVLQAAGWRVVPLSRRASSDGISWDLERDDALAAELRSHSVTALVHAAWDMHATRAGEYRRINLGGSRRLFEEACAAGVRNVIFISTISAFEEAVSLYGRTKLEAEKIAAQYNALSIRPGLVWGERSGSVFGALEKAVQGGRYVPLIGSGIYAQYLVHEDDLASAVVRALTEKWRDAHPRAITIANPRMWLFRDLLLASAARAGRRIKLVSLPWRAVWSGLKVAETAGLHLPFRSDSVLSLVNQNPRPDFSALRLFDIRVREYPDPSREPAPSPAPVTAD